MVDNISIDTLRTIRNAIDDVLGLVEENRVLQRAGNDQSTMVRALVLQHGGIVSGDIWDEVNKDGSVFLPNGIRSGKNGTVIISSDSPKPTKGE